MLFSALRSSRRSVLALLATAAVLVAPAAYANPLEPGSPGQAQPLSVQSPDRAGSSRGVSTSPVVTSVADPRRFRLASDAIGISGRRVALTLLLRIAGTSAPPPHARTQKKRLYELQHRVASMIRRPDRTSGLVSYGTPAL